MWITVRLNFPIPIQVKCPIVTILLCIHLEPMLESKAE